MVLLVKLKNPNSIGSRSIEGLENRPSPAADSDRSAVEQDHSPSPLPQIIHDDSLDELSSALQQAQIDNTESQDIKIEVVESNVELKRPAVDVLIAPAVLGHRWIRTRSNAFVVERPERVRAVSMGIAALLAKVQSIDEREKSRLDSVTTNLASMGMESSNKSDVSPLSVHLSQATLSLLHPSEALKMVHALEGEYISPADIGTPAPPVSENDATKLASPATSLPYTSFLARLCSQAPSQIPPPPAPRNLRTGISPSKTEEKPTLEQNHHPSEVPLHLPQGDLYLCGPRQSNLSYFDPATGLLNAQESTASSEQPHTPRSSFYETTLSNETTDGEEFWRKGGSRGAIEAALGTGCAAVDRVVCASLAIKVESQRAIKQIDVAQLQRAGSVSTSEPSDIESQPALRSFVLVRPPGHHCNATQPSGFCWVNNVAVMAAHAYHQHGIDRVAILDFDLHHGNGTQAIAWRINAETVRHDLELEARNKMMRSEQEKKARRQRRSAGGNGEGVGLGDEEKEQQPDRRGLKIFYGSMHDIESFPCEDGNKELVTDASMCIEGAHGQWIWNVHLDSSKDANDSQRLYDAKYSQLLHKARAFFAQTNSNPQSSLVLISAGFDACTHEQAGMQRHGKSVPPQFYEDFTRDTVAMADEWCAGKCVSILEGGYSDRALTSGAIAHLIGLGLSGVTNDLYQPSTLYQLEKIAKTASTSQQRRKNDALAKEGIWLDYTLEAFRRLEEICGKKRPEMGTSPVTPTRAMIEELWKSPREMRNGRGGGGGTFAAVSSKVSPSK